MSIKNAIFKIFNGSAWDEYHMKTNSGQVQHTPADGDQTTVKDALDELNSNMDILDSRGPGSAGRALKIYDVSSENLKYGCYGEGLYIYPPYYGTEKGAPDDWGGYMITVGIGSGSSKKHLKYAYTLGGSVYFMRQAAETGTVEQDWTKISAT